MAKKITDLCEELLAQIASLLPSFDVRSLFRIHPDLNPLLDRRELLRAIDCRFNHFQMSEQYPTDDTMILGNGHELALLLKDAANASKVRLLSIYWGICEHCVESDGSKLCSAPCRQLSASTMQSLVNVEEFAIATDVDRFLKYLPLPPAVKKLQLGTKVLNPILHQPAKLHISKLIPILTQSQLESLAIKDMIVLCDDEWPLDADETTTPQQSTSLNGIASTITTLEINNSSIEPRGVFNLLSSTRGLTSFKFTRGHLNIPTRHPQLNFSPVIQAITLQDLRQAVYLIRHTVENIEIIHRIAAERSFELRIPIDFSACTKLKSLTVEDSMIVDSLWVLAPGVYRRHANIVEHLPGGAAVRVPVSLEELTIFRTIPFVTSTGGWRD